MSESAIIAWMSKIDERLAALQASVVGCQARRDSGGGCGEDVAAAVVAGVSKNKAVLAKSIAYLVSAAVGAALTHFVGQ